MCGCYRRRLRRYKRLPQRYKPDSVASRPANRSSTCDVWFLVFTACSKLRKVLFLALSITFSFIQFFVCESNIYGTAEWICAKFTGKTCLVPRLEYLNVKVTDHRLRLPGTKTHCPLPSPPGSDGMVPSAACSALQCIVKLNGGLRAVYVW